MYQILTNNLRLATFNRNVLENIELNSYNDIAEFKEFVGIRWVGKVKLHHSWLEYAGKTVVQTEGFFRHFILKLIYQCYFTNNFLVGILYQAFQMYFLIKFIIIVH